MFIHVLLSTDRASNEGSEDYAKFYNHREGNHHKGRTAI